jgi:hypothetical protein
MNIQLANVLSDVSGVTRPAILKAILAGERDPHKLAALRDPRGEAMCPDDRISGNKVLERSAAHEQSGQYCLEDGSHSPIQNQARCPCCDQSHGRQGGAMLNRELRTLERTMTQLTKNVLPSQRC